MPKGDLPTQNGDDERIPPWGESSPPTSDNRYPDPNFYTARQVARWIGVSPTRVRQLSIRYNVGKKTERYWIYSLGDIIVLGNLTRKGRSPMRNVTPRSDPDLLLAELKGQDELRKVMVAYWRKLTSEVRMFISDISTGLYNRTEKLADKVEHQWHEVYTDLHGHGDRLYRLEKELKRLEELLKIDPDEPKESGRGVASLAARHPRSPWKAYGAEAA